MMDSKTFRDVVANTVLTYKTRDGAVIVGRNGGRAEWLFDFRAVLLSPEWLNYFAERFWQQYESHYPFQVGGMETVGIALVAAIVMKGVERKTPVNGFFVRKSRKKDGLLKTIEGTLTDAPVILVDDLINSGSTFDKQLLLFDEIGLRVTDIFTALRFRAYDAYMFANTRDIRIHALLSLEDFNMPLLSAADPEVPQESFATRWHYRGPAPSLERVVEKSAPALFEDLVIFGSDDGVMRALDTTSGAVRWEFRIGRHRGGKGIFSSPLVHNGVVFFGGYDGNVYALNAKNGELKWTYEEADWIGSSPCINTKDDLLYIGLEFGLFGKQGGIAALRATDGVEVWRDTTGSFTHSSPLSIEEENLVVIGSNDHLLYAYDARSGTRRWTYQTGGDIKSRPAYDALSRLIAVNSMDGKCHVVRSSDGIPVYAMEAAFGFYSSPLIVNHLLYVASLDKTLYAVNLETLKEVWAFDTTGRIFSTPAYFDSSVWIGSNDGKLYELDPMRGTLRSYFQATERIVNAPAYDSIRKRIYVGTQANEMYCIERSGNKKAPSSDAARGTF